MEVLRELIKDKRLSVIEFCRDAKFSRSTVENWLNDVSFPTRANMERLASYFGVPVERFEAARPQECVTIETPIAEIPAEQPEKTITRAEYIRASKRSMEKLQEIMGDSKSAMLAAEFLRCDTERRLW